MEPLSSLLPQTTRERKIYELLLKQPTRSLGVPVIYLVRKRNITMKQRHISNSSSLSGWNCFFTEDLQSSGGDGTVFSHLCVSSFPGQELLTYIYSCM